MSENASYAKIGFTIVLGAVAALGALIYIGGFSDGKDRIYAETYYDSPVDGLSAGSEVNFRGVKVGEVKSVSFIGFDYPEADEKDRQKIRIVIAFDPKLVGVRDIEDPESRIRNLVRRGVRATIGSSGITGLAKVRLNFPSIDFPEEKISWTSEYVFIPPAPSILESFSVSATKVMNHLNKMNLAEVTSNMTSMVSSAAKTAQSLDALIETSSPRIETILSNLESASMAIKNLAEKLDDEPSLLLRSAERPVLPETDFRSRR